MIKKILPIGLLLLLALPALLQAQSKKKIKELGITSIEVHEYFLEESKDKYVVEQEEYFDEEGRLIELKESNRRNEIQKWEKYVYDEDDRLIEEIFLNARGKVESREVTIYKDKLRVEKQYFDAKDNMVKKKLYIYKYE